MSGSAPPLPAQARILIVRLGSMGDIVHALPAVHALRTAYPQARMDWLVEGKWRALVHANPDVNRVIELDRSSLGGILRVVQQLRASHYDCALDFQGLYKSAVMAFFAGARRRIGFSAAAAREAGAAAFYSHRVHPAGVHVVEQNLEIAAQAGPTPLPVSFPELRIPAEAEAQVRRMLGDAGLDRFYLISPGGGWRSKCWPPEHYGHVHRKLAEKHGLRGVVSYGPGEKALAESVRIVAHEPPPLTLDLNLEQLMAAVKRAALVVAADTGPLHLAGALGTPAVALFGPTDPARNGPRGSRTVVVRNAAAAQTTYKRGENFSPAMLSIQVEQVLSAIESLLELRA